MKYRYVLIAAALFASAASADKVCSNVYNPMSGQWEYQCVDRNDNEYPARPVCHQEYDPMNGVWVTVCN